jgi:hypothetical protein
LWQFFDNKFFFTPLFCCCFWIGGPGWVKIRIRDKHPGSAKLLGSSFRIGNYFKSLNRIQNLYVCMCVLCGGADGAAVPVDPLLPHLPLLLRLHRVRLPPVLRCHPLHSGLVRIRRVADPDPHYFWKLDPDPH